MVGRCIVSPSDSVTRSEAEETLLASVVFIPILRDGGSLSPSSPGKMESLKVFIAVARTALCSLTVDHFCLGFLPKASLCLGREVVLGLRSDLPPSPGKGGSQAELIPWRKAEWAGGFVRWAAWVVIVCICLA